jgi:7,8-dihydropterin-6-yl-methyl-4-(beta-D-ribofuranosyl)aminobenzene 5'-phosphate synthase
MNTNDVNITILVDNQAGPGLPVEYGFSLWIEDAKQVIFFDTGQGQAVVPDARTLGIVPAKAQILVLSRGHYDHTGAIFKVPAEAAACKVCTHPALVQPCYAARDGHACEIGIPAQSLAAIFGVAPERRFWVSEPMRLSERIGFTGPIDRRSSNEDTGEQSAAFLKASTQEQFRPGAAGMV